MKLVKETMNAFSVARTSGHFSIHCQNDTRDRCLASNTHLYRNFKTQQINTFTIRYYLMTWLLLSSKI